MSSLLRKLSGSLKILRIMLVLVLALLLTLALSPSILAMAGPDAIGP